MSTLVAIHVAAARGEPMTLLDTAKVDRLGIVGDRARRTRYRRATAVTLVAEEDVATCAAALGVTLTPVDTRRNLVTRGVDLAALVGRRLQIGGVELLGVEPCDPCRLLERRTHKGVGRHLHGGLRCDVVTAGEIAVGDRIVALP